MYTRIVVPLDGSALAEEALEHAKELSRRFDAPLQLIRVVDSGPVGPFGTFEFPEDYPPFAQIIATERDESADYLARLEAQLRDDRLNVATEIRVGGVAQELLAAAQPGDLFVLASHGRGGLSRWFMGSIAEDVTRRSTVPVLLVRVGDAKSIASTPAGPRATGSSTDTPGA